MDLQTGVASLLAVLILNCAPMSAQTRTTSPVATGTVEGRVFGISRTGDLKPARMPSMYLLYKGRGESLEQGSADNHYQNESITNSINTSKRLQENPAGDETLECREYLLGTDQALAGTAQWPWTRKGQSKY
jgi:hypothetical protein